MSNKLFSKIKYLSLPSLIIGMSLASLSPVMADGSSSMTLSASSTSVKANATVTVTLNENSGTSQVNVAEAAVSYNSYYLQYQSTSFSGSYFNMAVANSGGYGTAKFIRGTTKSLSGNQEVATVTFTALRAGQTSVGLNSANSNLASSGNALNPTLNGTQINISGSTSDATANVAAVAASPAVSTTKALPETKASSSSASQSNAVNSETSGLDLTTSDRSLAINLPTDTTARLSNNVSVVPADISSNPVFKVEYYLNNSLVASQSNGSSYAYNLKTNNLRNGNYKLVTKTFFTNGNIALTSDELQVANTNSAQQFALQVKHYLGIVLVAIILIAFAIYARNSLIKRQLAEFNAPKPMPTEPVHTDPNQKDEVVETKSDPDDGETVIIHPDDEHKH
jgi:hypothetical protein